MRVLSQAFALLGGPFSVGPKWSGAALVLMARGARMLCAQLRTAVHGFLSGVAVSPVLADPSCVCVCTRACMLRCAS